MDWKLAWAEAIVKGHTVSGAYECDNCGAWHLGVPKRLWRVCTLTGKRVFDSEKQAEQALKEIEQYRVNGSTKHTERSFYRCHGKRKCGGWHLTSMEEK